MSDFERVQELAGKLCRLQSAIMGTEAGTSGWAATEERLIERINAMKADAKRLDDLEAMKAEGKLHPMIAYADNFTDMRFRVGLTQGSLRMNARELIDTHLAFPQGNAPPIVRGPYPSTSAYCV